MNARLTVSEDLCLDELHFVLHELFQKAPARHRPYDRAEKLLEWRHRCRGFQRDWHDDRRNWQSTRNHGGRSGKEYRLEKHERKVRVQQEKELWLILEKYELRDDAWAESYVDKIFGEYLWEKNNPQDNGDPYSDEGRSVLTMAKNIRKSSDEAINQVYERLLRECFRSSLYDICMQIVQINEEYVERVGRANPSFVGQLITATSAVFDAADPFGAQQ